MLKDVKLIKLSSIIFLAFSGDFAPKVCKLCILSNNFINTVSYLFCLTNIFKLSSALILP